MCVKIYPGLEAQTPILITGRHHLVIEFCYHIGIVDREFLKNIMSVLTSCDMTSFPLQGKDISILLL
jgi:hypothetical protein